MVINVLTRCPSVGAQIEEVTAKHGHVIIFTCCADIILKSPHLSVKHQVVSGLNRFDLLVHSKASMLLRFSRFTPCSQNQKEASWSSLGLSETNWQLMQIGASRHYRLHSSLSLSVGKRLWHQNYFQLSISCQSLCTWSRRKMLAQTVYSWDDMKGTSLQRLLHLHSTRCKHQLNGPTRWKGMRLQTSEFYICDWWKLISVTDNSCWKKWFAVNRRTEEERCQ